LVSKRKKAEALLVLITFIWGSTFVIVKEALKDASPLPFLAVRFSLAGILLFAVMARRGVDRRSLAPGLLLGVFLFGGYLFQTWGLVRTTPSKAAFITGFSVILVPLILIVLGSPLRTANLAGAGLGLAGIYFLVLPSGLEAVNSGDLLVLLGACSFAGHIILVGIYARRFSFLHLVPVQILAVGLLAAVALPLDPLPHFQASARLGMALMVTVLLATGLAFSVQNWAQQYTPAAHAALIFALEPVFAVLTSWWALGERLGGKALVGCVLMLVGMVISERWGGGAPSAVES